MDREDWNRRYADRELVWTAEPNRFLATEAAGLMPGRALKVGLVHAQVHPLLERPSHGIGADQRAPSFEAPLDRPGAPIYRYAS